MGYYLETKLQYNRQNEFFVFIQQLCRQEATVVENFSNRFLFNIPRESIDSLAVMFELLEKEKAKGLLIEYSFSQCTLEQVFIKFAREQVM
jgi:ATP-binding cassette subfamily A (ABC1) protein 5